MTAEMPKRCAIIINDGANDGRAAIRWARIAEQVAARLSVPTIYLIRFRPPADLELVVRDLLADGCRAFVSAGGDGSVHTLLNLLVRLRGESTPNLWLGGIGLGSSNDFIKPKQHFIGEIPVRLDAAGAVLADVGKVEWQDATGALQTEYFIANASMGVTAEANWRFNHGDAVIRFLKKRWTDAAILYTAVRTIAGYKNVSAQIGMPGKETVLALSNLAVLKIPYVSGSFLYDDPVQPGDGLLGVNICRDMGLLNLLRVLAGLGKGRFRGQPKTISTAVDSLTVRTAVPVALEMDGEVVQTTYARFSLLPRNIYLMGL